MAHSTAGLPDPVTKEAKIIRPDMTAYTMAAASVPGVTDAMASLRTMLNDPHGNGWAVLDIPDASETAASTAACQRMITAVLGLMASPLHVHRSGPLWEPMGVRLDEGPGWAPLGADRLHIDLGNATVPPDYAALWCEREDPAGGGDIIVCPSRPPLSALTDSQRQLLTQDTFIDEVLRDTDGVGREMRPFPLYDGDEYDGYIRYSGKMSLYDSEDAATAAALDAYESHLDAHTVRFRLKPDQVLLTNQHMCLHGRMPLGDGQQDIPEAERRQLHLLLLRRHPWRSS
jgi:hypothetical protein